MFALNAFLVLAVVGSLVAAWREENAGYVVAAVVFALALIV